MSVLVIFLKKIFGLVRTNILSRYWRFHGVMVSTLDSEFSDSKFISRWDLNTNIYSCSFEKKFKSFYALSFGICYEKIILSFTQRLSFIHHKKNCNFDAISFIQKVINLIWYGNNFVVSHLKVCRIKQRKLISIIWGGKVKHALRVASYKLQVQIHELRIRFHELGN